MLFKVDGLENDAATKFLLRQPNIQRHSFIFTPKTLRFLNLDMRVEYLVKLH